MRKWIAVLAAGVLIVGGAAVAFAQTDDTDPAGPPFGDHRANVLQEVLDELVTANTITQSQADAIVGALEVRRAEFEAAREEMRAQHEEMRAAIEEAWSDDVLTADEAAGLPFADELTDPEGPFGEAWSDGRLTREEFDAVRAELGPRPGPRGHHGRGFGPGAPLESDTSLSA